VLLPAAWRNWSTDERRAVLAHELAHVAQRHFPLWLLGQVAVAAHYYHPLMHWLGRRLRLEQELAADELAIRVFGDRGRYAALLAGLALGPAKPAAALVSLGLFMSRPLLMRRIAMLRKSTLNTRRPPRIFHALSFVVMIGVAMAVVGVRTSAGSRAADAPDAGVATHEVTALIRVSQNQPRLIGRASENNNDRDWTIFCNTQVALLRSAFVLQSALRTPGIHELPLVRDQQDHLAFLRDRLEIGFFDNSEILYIRMRGSSDEVEQLTKIVDAIARIYENEVIFKDEQRSKVIRDALATSFSALTDEIRAKMDDQYALAEELGAADLDGRSRFLQDLDVKRLERIDVELLRLEEEQLAAKIYFDQEKGKVSPKERARLPFYEQRIEELRKRQAELLDKIGARSQVSVELEVGARELEQLRRIADDMNIKLEQFDVEAVAPPRIRIVQQATVMPIATRKPGAVTSNQ
jgi:hypothetical protein